MKILLASIAVAVIMTACSGVGAGPVSLSSSSESQSRSLASELRARGNRGRTSQEKDYIATLFSDVERSVRINEVIRKIVDSEKDRKGPSPEYASELDKLPDIENSSHMAPLGIMDLGLASATLRMFASDAKMSCRNHVIVWTTESLKSCMLWYMPVSDEIYELNSILRSYDALYPR